MSPRDKLKSSRQGKVAKVCKRCDKEFFLWPHQAKRRKYCSRSCMREQVQKTCEQCGITFYTSKKSSRKVCGSKCPALRVEYDCIVCDTLVSRPRCFGQGKFCSNRCYHLWLLDNDITIEPRIGMHKQIRTKVSKRKKAIRNGEYINDHDVFEFYEWTCIVCEKEIDPDLVWPDKMSATLEHIIPLAKGGTHTWDNVAPSHLLCNSNKGSEIVEAVVARYEDWWDERDR